MGGQVWEVIGGKKDGLLVRTGKSLKSPEAEGRLAFGAFVEELALEGERLQYQKLDGDGPETGWVSLKLKGNDLLAKVSKTAEEVRSSKSSQKWPQEPLERMREVVAARRDEAVQAAKGNIVFQFVVTDASEGGKFYVQVQDGQVAVHEGQSEHADSTLAATAEVFAEMWQGALDDTKFEFAGNKIYARRLHPVLLVEAQDPEEVDRRTPADGVIRPPAGGQATGAWPAGGGQAQAPEAAPGWLKPDGQEKSKKLLFLSLPWAGHIIHLKRVATWFAQHPAYEVHFAYFSKTAPDLPSSVITHGADESELTPIFDKVQDNLKALGMREWGGGGILDVDGDLGTDCFKVLKFLLRVCIKVKPTVYMADSAFTLGGFLQAIAQIQKGSVMLVYSPGIKEKWIASANQQNEGVPTFIPPEDMPNIDIGQVMAGTFDVTTLPIYFQDILKAPGVDLMKLLQVFGAMAKPDPKKTPIDLYPSSSWMVEDQPVAREVFTGTLLPLPELVEGEVQLSSDALKGHLDADLHSWLFSDATQDPVVYVAFGTIVQGAKPIVEKLAAALDGGRWRVLWSLPADMHVWLPAGLAAERWCVKSFLPQKEVFRCERVKCFISHCGANSTIEAMACGVPMVCHPFFLDQYEWARTVRRHLRAGVQVDKFDSGPDAIRLAVTEVLEDPSYRAAAQAVSKRLQAQAAQLKTVLGADMCPKENLGPGVSVIAALILSLMKGKDPWEIVKLVQQTNQ